MDGVTYSRLSTLSSALSPLMWSICAPSGRGPRPEIGLGDEWCDFASCANIGMQISPYHLLGDLYDDQLIFVAVLPPIIELRLRLNVIIEQECAAIERPAYHFRQGDL